MDPTYAGTGIIWSDVGGLANDFILGGTQSPTGVNRLSFFVGGSETTVTGTQEISTGQWMHLAVTRDAVSGAVKLYVNGALDGAATAGLAVLNANARIHIGGNTLDGRYFNGLIDDVRFYSRVLTPAEIATLLPYTPPTVTLATSSNTVTNSFAVTASFSKVVSDFNADDIVVLNGHTTQPTGSGGLYSFTVTPEIPGPITIRIPASRVIDSDGNGNLASADLNVMAGDGAVPSLGLVDYWSFNESSGLTAFDSSGANNHGALMNLGNSNRVAGVWGNALSFNGLNSYVAVSNNIGGDFSISFWIKTSQPFPQTDTIPDGVGLLWSDVSGGNNDFIIAGTRNVAGTNRLSFFTGNPNSAMHGTKGIPSGKWTHLAVVRRQSTGERRLFVNGVFDISSIGGIGFLSANPAIHIGGNTLNSHYLLGQMDEVRVYNRALSDSEIASLAAGGGYASWVTATMPNVSASLTDPMADPDGDGQRNLLEFAFDTNPLQADAPSFKIQRAADGSLNLSYPRRTGFSGLAYTILQSDDLTTWSPIEDGIIDESTQIVPGKSLEIVTGRIVDLSQQAFFRLEVRIVAP